MELNRQLAGYRNDSIALSLLTTSGSQMQSPLSKCEDVVRTLDQHTSEISVAGLRDAELGIAISGLNALSRFDHDVLAQTGARVVVLL